MSYCRWSSDDWRCDLYVYEDTNGGWTIHVAGNRIADEDAIPRLAWPESPEEWAAWPERFNAQNDLVMRAERRPIGGPFDGVSFNLPTAGACADKVEALLSFGYRAPAHVVVSLRAEASRDG